MNVGPPTSSEEDLLQFFYLCPVGIVEIDATGQIHRLNPRASQLLMPIDKPATLENLFKILAPFDQQLKLTVQASSSPRTRILEHHRIVVRHDGYRTHLEFSVYRVSAERFMLALLDVTSLADAENLVRSTEARLRSVLDNAVDYIYRFSFRTGGYEYFSANIEKLLGYSPAEMKELGPEGIFALVNPEDLPSLRAALDEALRTGESQFEFRQRTKRGDERRFACQIWVTTDAAGNPLYRDGSIRDITPQKRAK